MTLIWIALRNTFRTKTRQGSPVDSRPSSDKAPPKGKFTCPAKLPQFFNPIMPSAYQSSHLLRIFLHCSKPICLSLERPKTNFLLTLASIFSRPGQSHGLLYKHSCHSLINGVTLCENVFTPPPSDGLRWFFRS